jgi:hypothetical protein
VDDGSAKRGGPPRRARYEGASFPLLPPLNVLIRSFRSDRPLPLLRRYSLRCFAQGHVPVVASRNERDGRFDLYSRFVSLPPLPPSILIDCPSSTAAGLTLDSVGWAHEGSTGTVGTWDRSGLGWPETWRNDVLLPGREWPPVEGKGKGRSAGPSRSPSGNPLSAATSPYTDFSRSFSNSSSSSSTHSNGYYHHQQAPKPQRSRSGTVTAADEEVVQFSSRDSALLSPTLNSSASSSFRQHLDDGSRSSSPYGSRPASPPGANEARSGWRKVGEELTAEEEQERRERLEQEENERELMA